MKHWLRMSGEQIVKIASSFSLLLVFATLGFSTDYREIEKKLQTTHSPEQVLQALEGHYDDIEKDQELITAVDDLANDFSTEGMNRIKELVSLRAAAQPPVDSSAKTQVQQIKSSPLYRDSGVGEQSNWLDGALKRLKDLIPKREINAPRTALPSPGLFSQILIPIVWGLLAVAIIVFGYFGIKHFQWKKALRRKAKAVLEDDEPERTLDEWLAIADEYSLQGKFREAVRALYLACLLKFDEAGVARFIRGETNWEHLSRIRSSGRLPNGLDFTPATKAFDRIWYGFHVQGNEDVESFRVWYQEVRDRLQENAA